MQRGGISGTIGDVCLPLGLLMLTGIGSNVLEGDGALDLLASKDSLVVPANEDADVAGAVRDHCGARWVLPRTMRRDRKDIDQLGPMAWPACTIVAVGCLGLVQGVLVVDESWSERHAPR